MISAVSICTQVDQHATVRLKLNDLYALERLAMAISSMTQLELTMQPINYHTAELPYIHNNHVLVLCQIARHSQVGEVCFFR